MPIYTNNNGIWKEIDTSHVNVRGVLKEIETIFGNVDGAWKEIWTLAKDTFIITPALTRAEIQEVLDISVNGAYLIFEVGDYYFDNGLIIKHSNTYLKGKIGTRIFCDYANGNPIIGTVTTKIHNIGLSGLYIDGQVSSGKSCAGIMIDNVSSPTLASEDTGGYTAYRMGVNTLTNNNIGVTIRDCHIRNTFGIGVIIRRTSNSLVENVSVRNGSMAFSIVNTCTNITIENCKMQMSRASAMKIGFSYRITLNNCFIGNNEGGVTIEESTHCQLMNNKFTTNLSENIRVYNSRANIISGNDIRQSSSAKGIYVDGNSKGNNIVSNIIRDCIYGIQNLNTATYNYYCGNLLKSNSTQISVTGTGVINNYNRSTT